MSHLIYRFSISKIKKLVKLQYFKVFCKYNYIDLLCRMLNFYVDYFLHQNNFADYTLKYTIFTLIISNNKTNKSNLIEYIIKNLITKKGKKH